MSDEPIDLTRRRMDRDFTWEEGEVRPEVFWSHESVEELGFVDGLHAETLMELMRQGQPRIAPVAMRARMMRFMQEVAPQLGYSASFELTPDPYWVWPVFTLLPIELASEPVVEDDP